MLEKPNEVAEKLRKHAANVQLAGHDCSQHIEALKKVSESDEDMVTSKNNLLGKERMKQKCLYSAADYLVHVAELLEKEVGE